MTITQDASARSESGAGQSAVYTTIATVWCTKRDLTGRELFAAAQDMAEIGTARFTIRHRSDVTADMRVSVEGVNYDITHIAEIGRRRGLELTCIRRGSDQ